MIGEFIGRKKELADLEAFLQKSLTSEMQVCFVTGEAGAGKTSLIAEFADQAQDAHEKLIFVTGNCNAQTGISDPYLPFRQILSLLTGDEARLSSNAITDKNANRLKTAMKTTGRVLVEIAPELVGTLLPVAGILVALARLGAKERGLLEGLEKQAKGPGRAQDIDQAQIFLQFTALLRDISNEYPLVIILDDLHWVDAASNALFFHLTRELTGCRILLIGLYRANDVAAGRDGQRHPLEQTISEIKRYRGNVWIDLDEATTNDGQAFVEELLNSIPNSFDTAFREALFRHTGGHALFTTELLKKMQENGELVLDEQGRLQVSADLNWHLLPAKVEAVIEERIERLADELRDILTVAAVEGVDFTAQVIARVQQIEGRFLIKGLSQELDRRHQLVREIGEKKVGQSILSQYAFNHILAQLYIYNYLGSAERRILHGDIAEALENLYEGHTEEIAVQLAYHFTEAQKHEKAAEYLHLAGDQAFRLGEFSQARVFYSEALSVLDMIDIEETDATRAYLLWRIGGTYYHTGYWQESEPYFLQSLHYARNAKDKELLAQILIGHAHQLRKRRNTVDAKQAIDEALSLIYQTGNLALESQALLALSPIYSQMGDYHSRIDVIEKARKIAIEIGDVSLEMACLNSLGVINGSVFGNFLKAIDYYEEALQLALQVRNLTAQSLYLANLFTYRRFDALKKARQALERNTAIKKRLKNIPGTHESFKNLGILRLKENEYEEAVQNFSKSRDIADEYKRVRGQVNSRSWLAIVHLLMGQLSHVKEDLESQKPFLSEYRNKTEVFSETLLEGILYLQLAQFDKAQMIFQLEFEQATKALSSQRWAYRYHRAFAKAGMTLLASPDTHLEYMNLSQDLFNDAIENCGWVGVLDDALLILGEIRKKDDQDILKPIEDNLEGKRKIAWHNRPFRDE